MKTQLTLTYLGKDDWDREVFEDANGRKYVDIALNYENHRGMALHTISNNEFDGEPSLPLKMDNYDITITNDEERKRRNENPFRFEYMMLDRLRGDVEYHLGYGHFGAIKDIERHIARMQELWDKVPEKPEWLPKEKLEKLFHDLRNNVSHLD